MSNGITRCPRFVAPSPVGAWWALATVAFEFVFGHHININGDSWETLRGAFDLAGGRLWSLDGVVIAAAPALVRGWGHRFAAD